MLRNMLFFCLVYFHYLQIISKKQKLKLLVGGGQYNEKQALTKKITKNTNKEKDAVSLLQSIIFN